MPSLDVIMIAFFPRNIHLSSLFAQKGRVNTERVPPGHPIILLKSSKFNMAAVSVERSITLYMIKDRIRLQLLLSRLLVINVTVLLR